MNTVFRFVNRRPWLGGALAITLCWLVLYWPFLSGHQVIGFDSLEQFYPTVFFNSQSIRSGDWPWWNPHIYGGYPQIADPQGMLFAPLLMLLMICVPSPTPTWFDFAVLLHLLLGSLGVLALARANGLRVVSGLLGAVIYIAGGPAAARLQHTPIILAYSWLPWCVLLAQKLAARRGWFHAVAFGLVLGALWVEVVQATYLFSLFIAAVAVLAMVQGVRRSGTPAEALALFATGVMAALLGVVLASPQWFATLAALPNASRATFPIGVPLSATVPLQALWTLVDPNHFGAIAGRYALAADPTETFLYWGVVPLAVSVVAVATDSTFPMVGRRMLGAACAVTLLLSIAYAFGWPRAVYSAAYKFLPGMALFKRPSDALFLGGFCISLLVAFLFDGLLRSPKAGAHLRMCVLLAGAAYAASLTADIVLQRSFGRDLLLLAVAVTVLFVQRRRHLTVSRVATLLIVLAVLDLRILVSVGHLNGRDSDAERFYAGTGRIASELRTRLAGDEPKLPPRVETAFTHENLWANGGDVMGYENTQGYNPFLVREYLERIGAQSSGLVPRSWTPWLDSYDARLFDVLGVRYLIVNHAMRPGSLRADRFRMLAEDGKLALWENTSALPRVLTPARGERIDANTFGSRIRSTNFRDLVLLEPRSKGEIEELDPLIRTCTGRVRATAIHVGNSSVELGTDSISGAGWVVLSDLDYPGWVSSIDGHERKYFRANGLFRAVCVPEGNHIIEFKFEPTRMLLPIGRYVPR